MDNFHSPIIFRNDRDQFQINFITLAQLFETLYTDEDKEMLKLHKTYYDKSMIFKTNKLRLENYGVSHKNESTKQMFDTKNWRLQYYTLLFDMNIYNDNVINTVCESYISGLLWIADYYFNKKTSSNWFYMYNYSPTILDVYNYLEVNKSNITQKKQTYDISSDLQLLMILPIHSKLILPMELQELVSNTSSIGHFYPEDFKI